MIDLSSFSSLLFTENAKLTLSLLVPLFVTIVQTSFLVTIKKIMLNYNRESYSILPFLSLCVSCYTWLLYGSQQGEVTVVITNSIGLILGGFGSVVYFYYSIFQPPLLYFLISTFFLLFSSFLACFSSVNALGILGMLLAICVYASPLSVMMKVLEEESTESLSFPISLSSWISAVTWLLYGIYVVFDGWIIFSSVIGLIVTSLQLGLFVRYGFERKEAFVDQFKE
jgi:solute carrier family 50 protein (sugar transporter)